MNDTSTSTLIKIPVVSFRKVENPYENIGSKMYVLVVDIRNLPETIAEWRGVNTRDPNLNSGVSKQIRQSLIDDSSAFFFKNRGLTLIVNRVRFDNKESIVEVEMVDKENNGLLDGGHTYAVIQEYLTGLAKEELEDIDGHVKVELLEGIKEHEDVVGIVEARNTSTQVKKESIEELLGSYAAIHRILEKNEYADRIAYKEYELTADDVKKDIDIKEILSYLICFDTDFYNKPNEHPIKAYSTKASVIDHFKKAKEEGDRMTKYIPLLPKILELRDKIYLDLPDAHNKPGGKFGKLTGVTLVSGKMSKTVLPFSGKESEYRIPSGFIYPILAAFRNLVKCKDNKCQWIANPTKVFEDLKYQLADRVCTPAKAFGNPNKLGKDLTTWRGCYDEVRLEVLERHL